MIKRSAFKLFVPLFVLLILTGCGSDNLEQKYPTGVDRSVQPDIYAERESVLGSGGLNLFGGKDDESEGSTGIGVNSFLWRASLDTVSFMPLASADPFGGVIITDWYTPSEKPNERFKLNVFILDKHLRSDGIQVKVFKQNNKGGRWVDDRTADQTARQLEEAILTRARQLRVAQLSNEE